MTNSELDAESFVEFSTVPDMVSFGASDDRKWYTAGARADGSTGRTVFLYTASSYEENQACDLIDR